MQEFVPGPWGPDRKRAAVSVTFDNFGEASDIARGRWPAGEPIGNHYTATEVLPRLLDALNGVGVGVTYFVEAVNAQRYPQQLLSLQEAGHEIGLHAWAHENWNRLDAEAQHANLDQSLSALDKIGIRPKGFRPPGGVVDSQGMTTLSAFGFEYCSPVSDVFDDGFEGDLLVQPFRWTHVDAYVIDPDLAEFRRANGDSERAASVDEWNRILLAGMESAIAEGKHLTVIFHPQFLGRDERQWEALMTFIANIKARDDIWLARSGDVAQWTRSRRG